MNRRMSAALAATSLVALAMVGARAAQPGSGTISPSVKRVSWSGGPLTGSAPSRRNESCAQGVNCDDFFLDVRVSARTFRAPALPMIVVTLSAAAPSDIRLLVSKPGTDDSIGQNDYTVYGAQAKFVSPVSGRWRIRAACYACANATYTATAVLVPFKPPVLEPVGDFRWFNVTIPGPGGGEPGIIVDKQGRIFVNAPYDSASGAGSVWRSLNKGRTWDAKYGIDTMPPAITGDTDLAVAPDDGTVYFMNLNYGGFTNWVYTSRDHGATYTGPAHAGSDSDRQWFTAAPGGRVYVTFHDLASAASQMWVYRSDDYGKTFLPISSVALGASSMVDSWCGNHQAGRPQLDPRNRDVYYIFYSIAPFAECTAADPGGPHHPLSQVWIAKSVDGGRTFTHTKVYESHSNTDHNLMGLDVDTAGNLYIVIAESVGDRAAVGEDALSTHVKLIVSKDKGATWSRPMLVDRLKDHRSNVFAAVAAGDPGRVNIAWYTSRSKSFLDPQATWTIAMAQSTNALSARPTFKQSRVSSGVVHTGPICQAGLGCTVSGANRNLLDFMAIDIGPDGMAHVIWAADTTGEVKIQYARQTRGPSAFAKRPRR